MGYIVVRKDGDDLYIPPIMNLNEDSTNGCVGGYLIEDNDDHALKNYVPLEWIEKNSFVFSTSEDAHLFIQEHWPITPNPFQVMRISKEEVTTYSVRLVRPHTLGKTLTPDCKYVSFVYGFTVDGKALMEDNKDNTQLRCVLCGCKFEYEEQYEVAFPNPQASEKLSFRGVDGRTYGLGNIQYCLTCADKSSLDEIMIQWRDMWKEWVNIKRTYWWTS